MTIDWVATLEFGANLMTLATGILAFVAFFIARRELESWKLQTRGESKYRAATQVKLAVYEWRKALNRCYESEPRIRNQLWVVWRSPFEDLSRALGNATVVLDEALFEDFKVMIDSSKMLHMEDAEYRREADRLEQELSDRLAAYMLGD